jgi:hypothetical protein
MIICKASSKNFQHTSTFRNLTSTFYLWVLSQATILASSLVDPLQNLVITNSMKHIKLLDYYIVILWYVGQATLSIICTNTPTSICVGDSPSSLQITAKSCYTTDATFLQVMSS